MSDELIAFDAVSIFRSGNEILREVTWRVAAGERWVVFGPNGSGKTTALQVASTYLAPSRGSARVLGNTIGRVDVRTLRSRIGYVGAAPVHLVHRDLPVIEIVLTGKFAVFVDARWNRYEPSDWEQARSLLARVHAAELAERTYGTLSAGEQQRVMIARSLMADPELLLLDEPAANLDLGARERLVRSLGDVAADAAGPGMVMVTHHVEEIPDGFGHILVLAGGAVVGAGPIATTLTSATISAAFGMDLAVSAEGGRYRAWLVTDEAPGDWA